MRNRIRGVGQRFMVGFEGPTASADVRGLIKEFGVAHVILFRRNVEGPEQVADLVCELQSAAREAGNEAPLVVAIDQEGGRVARLGEPWTIWPPARALGRTGSEEVALRMGAALAEELRACGIVFDLAPVVDVDTNPRNPAIGDRSLGEDPELVGRLGAAIVVGLQNGGVAACAKHFPGHGDTSHDSHVDLPVLDHPRSRLEEVELRPFRVVIEAGVAAVMTSHLLLRELDGRGPASLSEPLTRGLLREDLGFDRMVLTDDLEMKAVATRWTPAERAVMAAKAGADVLAFCRDHDAQVAAMEGLIHALETGEIPFGAQEASQRRVEHLRERFLEDYRDPDPRLARRAAGREEHRALADEIAARAGWLA